MPDQIVFVLERETKNKVVYGEQGTNVIGTLYVSKIELRQKYGEFPARLYVTVSATK